MTVVTGIGDFFKSPYPRYVAHNRSKVATDKLRTVSYALSIGTGSVVGRRTCVRLPAGALPGILGQLSLPSLRGR